MPASTPKERNASFVRRNSFHLFVLLVCLISAGALVGCANVHLTGNPETPPPAPPGPPPTPVANGTVTITPTVAAVLPGQSFQFSATSSNGGAIQWSASGGGSVDQTGKYTAPASISQSENITVTAALASNPTQDSATAVVSVIRPGAFTCPPATGNPQVAQYTVYLPAPGKASVEFGTTTNYGLNTWQLPSPSGTGGQIQLWVAGMLGSTTYHMRGQIVLNNGATLSDADQTCTTGAPPPTTPVQTTANGTPQSGIEMWNPVLYKGNLLAADEAQAFATDLNGNVIWTYTYPHPSSDLIQGIQLLPNGNMLMTISFLSSLGIPGQSGLVNEVREVDLAGNTIKSITVAGLNKILAGSSFRDASGSIYQFKSFHHDVLALPNGHWVLLADYGKGYNNLGDCFKNKDGSPNNGNVLVEGDALIDVDQNGNPDWVWNTFDHLDIHRCPMNFPDWTHSNNMLYSSDDHNLVLSMRHQNWLIKINFLDGTGSGDIMWKLGYQGDFKLVGGTDPQDWFYAQHGMNYITSNTTGDFKIALMDNGNDRFFSPTQQVNCLPFKPANPQCYSTMPVIEINENNMTATLLHNYEPAAADVDFSFFGGNAEQLANGDYEVDFAAPLNGGLVQELSPSLQLVWQGSTPGADQYHADRWASLYPGIQW